MARYIDADELKEKDFTHTFVDPYDANIFEFILDETPTADVAEVKHGEWIDRDGKTWCSLCEASNKQYKPPYCPHCGAKMKGKDDV